MFHHCHLLPIHCRTNLKSLLLRSTLIINSIYATTWRKLKSYQIQLRSHPAEMRALQHGSQPILSRLPSQPKMIKALALITFTFSLTSFIIFAGHVEFITDPKGLKRFYRHYKPGDPNQKTCLQTAQDFPEPYTSEYFPTGGRVDTSGPVWSFHQHSGIIHPEDLTQAEKAAKHNLVKIKILNGKVYYRRQGIFSRLKGSKGFRRTNFLSGILMAMVWFEIPDMDLLFDPEDFITPPGGPIFQICANNLTGQMLDGFTVPWPHVIQRALGPTQMGVMSDCLRKRYPPEDRIQKVVWRGRSRRAEGKHMVGDGVGPREKAIMAGWGMTDLTDFGATSFFGSSSEQCLSWANVTENGHCPPLVDRIPLENYNKYAFVLDVDGRAWSERMSYLMLGNTPILKQRSRYPDYLTPHLGDSIEFFTTDVSDLENRIREVFQERSFSPLAYHNDRVAKMQELARIHLTHFGVARAIAYALTQYADKLSWVPRMEYGFTQFTSKELIIPSLPPEFVDRIRSRD